MPSRISLDAPARSPAYKAIAYEAGAQVNGRQAATTTVTVHSGHGFATNDRFLYALSETNILTDRVFTVTGTTSTTVTFSGAAFSFPDAAVLVNLGVDTVTVRADGSWPLPNYDASGVTMYSDAVGNNTITSVTIRPDHEIGFWANASPAWVLLLTMGNHPVAVYRQVGSGSGSASITVSGSTPVSASVGDFWLKTGGAGEPDILYTYMGHGNDTDDWTEVIRGQSV